MRMVIMMMNDCDDDNDDHNEDDQFVIFYTYHPSVGCIHILRVDHRVFEGDGPQLEQDGGGQAVLPVEIHPAESVHGRDVTHGVLGLDAVRAVGGCEEVAVETVPGDVVLLHMAELLQGTHSCWRQEKRENPMVRNL